MAASFQFPSFFFLWEQECPTIATRNKNSLAGDDPLRLEIWKRLVHCSPENSPSNQMCCKIESQRELLVGTHMLASPSPIGRSGDSPCWSSRKPARRCSASDVGTHLEQPFGPGIRLEFDAYSVRRENFPDLSTPPPLTRTENNRGCRPILSFSSPSPLPCPPPSTHARSLSATAKPRSSRPSASLTTTRRARFRSEI